MTTTLSSPQTGVCPARIGRIHKAAADILELEVELEQARGSSRPDYSAGAHVDLHLPNGLVRQYSLVSTCDEPHYRVAVALSPASRGGSAYIHAHLQQGQAVQVSVHRNNFPLRDCPDPAVLIAGGIGITPIWSMVRELERRAQRWTLYYCARTAGQAAFLAPLQALLASSAQGELITVFDHEPLQKPLALERVFETHGRQARYYCCGPAGMLDAFLAAAQRAGVPAERAHIERFAPTPVEEQGVQESTGFEIELRNGAVHHVAGHQSILDVLIQAGLNPMYSCKEGICGSCETRVLGGIPDHRDSLLSQQEQASNKTMLICVSRCKGSRLVLDI